ncbi:hypothetical protein EC991_003698 [Linnemannia zychae]|nr:hypothetical protein EC991_003698 [Linnemannia zychae]
MVKEPKNRSKDPAATAKKTGWRKTKKGLENVKLKSRPVPKQHLAATKRRRATDDATSCTEGKGVQGSPQGYINDHKLGKEYDDRKTADFSENNNCCNSENYANKAQERSNDTLKDKDQNLAETITLKQKLEEGSRKPEERTEKLEEAKTRQERGETKEKKLRVALKKGLKVQKSLNMMLRKELQKELTTRMNLEAVKVIVVELEKGEKLQMMVEEQLGLRRKTWEKGLGVPDVVGAEAAILKVLDSKQALPSPSDLQAPAA